MADNNGTAAKVKDKLRDGSKYWDFDRLIGCIFTPARLKEWSGFIIGGFAIAIFRGFLGSGASHAIAFLGLLHIAIIFALDFIHKKPLRKIHLTVILFWIFYILADYGILTLSIKSLSDGRIYIPDMLLSLLLSTYLAGILSEIRNYKSSDKKEEGEKIAE